MGRTMGCWLAARRPAIAEDEDGLSVGGELLNVNGSDFFFSSSLEPEKGTQIEETQVTIWVSSALGCANNYNNVTVSLR